MAIHEGVTYKLDFEDLSDVDDEACKAQILRPMWELEAEHFREDISNAQKTKSSTKHRAYYALQP